MLVVVAIDEILEEMCEVCVAIPHQDYVECIELRSNFISLVHRVQLASSGHQCSSPVRQLSCPSHQVIKVKESNLTIKVVFPPKTFQTLRKLEILLHSSKSLPSLQPNFTASIFD